MLTHRSTVATRRRLRRLLPLAALAALGSLSLATGCTSAERSDERSDAAEAPDHRSAVAPGGTVDSIIPIEEALRRFQADVRPADSLTGGAGSREALAARFVEALERLDTAAVRALVVDRAEFAYLYYPGSSHATPPRAQAPALAWFLIQQNSEKGIVRAFRRIGGQPLEFGGLDCDAEPRREGDNRLWNGCTVTLRVAGGEMLEPQRLFGTVIERDGRFKFVSYANQF